MKLKPLKLLFFYLVEKSSIANLFMNGKKVYQTEMQGES